VLVGKTPRLSLGCDFHLSYDNLQDVMISPERYTIEGSHYLLVELSNYSIPIQNQRVLHPHGRHWRHARADTSRAQSDSARDTAASAGMGGPGLRSTGDGFGGD
jgi:hypothetical protein